MIHVNPRHPHIDFSKPIQWRFPGIHGDEDDWLDCVLSQDGTYVAYGVNGDGMHRSLDSVSLRNTPMIVNGEIDTDVITKITRILAEANNLKKLNALRLSNMLYKEKTLPKKGDMK